MSDLRHPQSAPGSDGGTGEEGPERRLADHFGLFLGAVSEAVYIADLSCLRILLVNDAWCRITGWSREEALGLRATDFVLMDEVEWREAIQGARSGDAVERRLRRWRTASGKTLVMHVAAFCLGEGADRFAVVARDITAERSLQRANESRARREAALAEATRVAMTEHGEDGIAEPIARLLGTALGACGVLCTLTAPEVIEGMWLLRDAIPLQESERAVTDTMSEVPALTAEQAERVERLLRNEDAQAARDASRASGSLERARGASPDRIHRRADESGLGSAQRGDGRCEVFVVPVHGRGGVVGTLTVATCDALPDESDVSFVDSIAKILGFALARAESVREARGREAYFRTLLDASFDITFIVSGDGAIRFASGGVRRILGCDAGAAESQPVSDLLGSELAAQVRRLSAEGAPGEIHGPELLSVVRADGVPVDLEVVARNLTSDPEVRGVVLNVRDVSDRLAAELALRQSEERHRIVVRAANEGIWDLELRTTQVQVSARLNSLLTGRDLDETVSGDSLLAGVPSDDRTLLLNEVEKALRGESDAFELEHRVERPDGTISWLITRGAPVRDASGNVVRIIGSCSDITRRRLSEEAVRHAALHDGLTGLGNRTQFLDRVQHALAGVRRGLAPCCAVLFVDVDRFRFVNESYGHLAGDAMLRDVADRLRSCIRESDTLARVGGDEFAVLMDSAATVSEVIRVAERVAAALDSPFTVEQREFYSGASVGVALGDPKTGTAEELLRDADTAVHRAKGSPPPRIQLFDAEMHLTVLRRLQLDTDLRHAIDRGELRLVYQPIVALPSCEVSSLEALVRWEHGTRGFISPVEFIPVAEESGLIVELGRWVLREACRQMRAWLDDGHAVADLSVAVNVSPRQFRSSDLIRDVSEALRDADLPSHYLTAEITEGALMENAEECIGRVAELRGLGVRVQLDDFGTGYSSLAYLNRFPISTLKIDRSFVTGIETDMEKRKIAGTVASLALGLGMDVTAEGIESAEQADIIKGLPAHRGQGYYFSRPVAPGAIPRLLGRKLPV